MDTKKITDEIFSLLIKEIPEYWDGKESIIYMKENGCSNWRQMEWPGWFFQFKCEKILGEGDFLMIPGPTFGNVEFDGLREIPWDFKAHTLNANNSSNKIPTNGYQEVSDAIEMYGNVGFIIANGNALFDNDKQDFKKWHDELKGKISEYERDRIMRGAPSRRRKVAFSLQSIDFVILDKESLKYCGKFQEGMRNSDGTPRNPKVMLDISDSRLIHYSYKKEDK